MAEEVEAVPDEGDSPGQPGVIPRNPDGTFPKGYRPHNLWGTPGNPPPKNGGRPPKDAYIRELEAELQGNPDMRRALARRLLKTALQGRDGDSLRALQAIQDRIGGPVAVKIEGLSREAIVEELAGLLDYIAEGMPEDVRPLIAERARLYFQR